MIITMSHALNFDPNDGYWDFFYQVAQEYWDKLHEEFHFGTHLNNTWSNLQGEVVYRNLFNMKELPMDVWEFIKVDLQFHGQSFYKTVQDYMFNQIALCTFQILLGLMSLCGFQKHLTKDFKSTTYDVPCSLILQWGEGCDRGNKIQIYQHNSKKDGI